MSWTASLLAGFQVTINGRFWVIPEVDTIHSCESVAVPLLHLLLLLIGMWKLLKNDLDV
jgi:hypothetical protein